VTTTVAPAAGTGRADVARWLQRYGVYVALLALLAFNLAFTANFLSVANLRTQLVQAAPVCIVALGMALVIGTEGVDLSVGAVMALAAAVVLISSDLEELVEGADRVVVLRAGAVVGELVGDDVSEHAIMAAIAAEAADD